MKIVKKLMMCGLVAMLSVSMVACGEKKTEEQRVLYLSDTNRDHGGLVGCL